MQLQLINHKMEEKMNSLTLRLRPPFLLSSRWLAVGLVLLTFVLPFPPQRTTAFASELVPDVAAPTFVFETVYDGADFDAGHDVAVDAAGNVYVIAWAYNANNDVLVLKLAPEGTVLWTVSINGSKLDYGSGITVDGAGGVYITGWTDSADFPVVNPLQGTLNGPRDAFLAKLSAEDGSFIFSTYLGGSYSEGANDLAINSAGEIYLIGSTESTDFPTVNPIQGQLNTNYCFCADAFVSKISADGSTLLYSTYLGGGLDDEGRSIGLDGNNNIYIAGDTKSDDWPTANPIQPAFAGGTRDVFAAKISADGSTLDYSTYLGGEDWDRVGRIAVDNAGNAYVAGSTRSVSFPTTAGAFQEQFAGGILECGSPPFVPLYNCEDLFLTKIVPTGGALAYSTYLGGNQVEEGRGVAVDSNGRAHVVGYTHSPDFPPPGSVSPGNMFVSQLDASGNNLNYTLGINTASPTGGHGIAVDDVGDVYVTGAQNAPADVYVARLSDQSPPPSGTIHVHDIQLKRKNLESGYAVRTRIEVRDQNGAPVEGATVLASVIIDAEQDNLLSRTTNARGRVTFNTHSKDGGLWTVCVADIIMEGLDYDPAQNRETCDSIVYP